MRRLLGLAVALLVLTSTLPAAAQLAPEDLGALAGDSSLIPLHINRNGQVTGRSAHGVFSWTESEGISYVPRSSSSGFAMPANIRSVNDNGQVVGTDYLNYPESLTAHAFSWTREGGVVNLGTLGGSYSEAVAVNNSGHVVGQSFTTFDQGSSAFLWTAEAGMRDLGTLGGMNARAEAINESGQVVGWSDTPDFQVHAVLWTPATGTIQVLGIPPGWPSSSFAFASGVNDRGDVIGFGWVGSETRAFFRSAATGRMHDLGVVGGWPNLSALNNKGQVAITDTRGGGRAFRWTEDEGLMDLGTLGGGASQASAINEDGHVVGASLNRNGQWRAFLWRTPTEGMVDLGALDGFTQSGAWSINDSGHIVGLTYGGGLQRGTLWRRPAARPTQLAVSGTATYGDTATLIATLTASGGNAAARTVAFSLNGNAIGTATTDANGVATLTGVSVTGLNAGSYAGTLTATFVGADGHLPSSAQGTLTVSKANQTITFAGAPAAEIVGRSFLLTASASSGLPVAVAAAGACSISGMMATMNTPTGVCSLTADQAGNTNYNAAPQATQTTAANYDFKGFFIPIENVPAMNTVKAGSAIPVKFSLTGDQTLAILDGSPISTAIACNTGALVHAIDGFATTSSNGLLYDASLDQYVYVWKTDQTWADTCRQLVVRLADGTLHRANFKLLK